ncbi:hypothetical protein I4U23_004465 [Adineta vaga]|nr:hypothetical protein I4U23_004465 [Adineta vaga]
MGILSGKPIENAANTISQRGESSVTYFTDRMGTISTEITSTVTYESGQWRPVVTVAAENVGQNFMRGTVAYIFNNRIGQFLLGSLGCYFALRSFILLQSLIEYITYMYMNVILVENDQFNYLKYMNRHTLFLFFFTVAILFASTIRSNLNENIFLLQVIIFDLYSIIKIMYCAIYFRTSLYDLLLWLIVFCIILIINIKDYHSTKEQKLCLCIFSLAVIDLLANIIVLIIPYLLPIGTILATYIYKYWIFTIGLTSALGILLALILLCRK